MASPAAKGKVVAAHWFRKGLRLHDNPALLEAIKGSAVVYPLAIIDPWFAAPDKVRAAARSACMLLLLL